MATVGKLGSRRPLTGGSSRQFYLYQKPKSLRNIRFFSLIGSIFRHRSKYSKAKLNFALEDDMTTTIFTTLSTITAIILTAALIRQTIRANEAENAFNRLISAIDNCITATGEEQ